MTRKELAFLLAKIIISIPPDGFAIESNLYIECDSDIETWNEVKGLLTRQGLIQVTSSHTVRLTPLGIAKAKELRTILDSTD